MNKNIVIGILAVIIIALGAYAIWKTSTPASITQTNGTEQSTTTQTSPTSSTQKTSTTTTSSSSLSSSNVYTNTTYHFKMTLPKGISLRQDGASWSANTAYGVPGIRSLGISASCPNSVSGAASQVKSTVAINGVVFQKITGTGAFGGMQSNSLDASYCAAHNGQYYTLIFTDQYDRVTPGVQIPDALATYQTFDQEMQSLNFAFTTATKS